MIFVLWFVLILLALYYHLWVAAGVLVVACLVSALIAWSTS